MCCVMIRASDQCDHRAVELALGLNFGWRLDEEGAAAAADDEPCPFVSREDDEDGLAE